MKAHASRRRAPAPTPKPWLSLNAAPEISEATDRNLTRMVWALAGVLAIALFLMILGPHRVGDYFGETDFYGAYAEGARLIQQGQIIPSRYGVIGPGYEIALALVGFVVPELFFAAELLSIVATVATLLLWFYLLKRRAGARVAAVASLILATNHAFFRHGYGALTDAPAIALQAGSLYLLLARASGRAMIGAGVLAALAFLTRYNAIYLLPAGLITILLSGALVDRRARSALLFGAGFVGLVLPWVVYSLARGSGFSFQLHHNIAFEVYASARGIPWDTYQKELQPQFNSLWDVISRDPGAVVRRMFFNLYDHPRQDALTLLGWPTAVAAALGIFFGLKDGTLRRLWPLWLAGMLLFASLVPVFYSQRYSLALLPIYATLAAIPFASPLGAMAVGRKRSFWIKPLLLALPLAMALTTSVKAQRRVIDQLPREVLEVAQTLQRLKAPGDRVMARKGHIAYHGGVRPLAFPFTDSLATLAKYARDTHTRWLFFSWPEAETRPRLQYLLDTSAVVPGLTVRAATRPRPAVLYEIGPDFGRTPAWLTNDTLMAWHFIRTQLMIRGNDQKLLLELGEVGSMLGRLDETRRALELALQRDPKNVRAAILLGNIMMSSNDPASARVLYQHAAEVDPGSAEARIGLGWVSLSEGKEAEAASLWRPVIAFAGSRNTLERMLTLYRTQGDRAAEAEVAAALSRVAKTR